MSKAGARNIVAAVFSLGILAAAPAYASDEQADCTETAVMQSPAKSVPSITADEDTELLVCRLKQWTTFFLNFRDCGTDRLCRIDKFLTLLIGLNACVPADDD